MKLRLLPLAISVFATITLLEVQGAVQETSTPEYRHEFGLGVNPLAGFAGRTTGGDVYLDFDQSAFFSVAASYNIAIIRWLQFGVNTGVSHATTALANSTFFQLMGGPILNIPFTDRWLAHSLYVSGQMGVLLTRLSAGTTITTSNTELIVSGEIGYRLPIAEQFNWSPSLGTYKILDGSKFLFFARPVSFSFIF